MLIYQIQTSSFGVILSLCTLRIIIHDNGFELWKLWGYGDLKILLIHINP